jgi:DNA polymerase elongation subunit (family B)
MSSPEPRVPLVFPAMSALEPSEGLPGGIVVPEHRAEGVIASRASVLPAPRRPHLVFFLQQTEVVPLRDLRPVERGEAEGPPRWSREARWWQTGEWEANPDEDEEAEGAAPEYPPTGDAVVLSGVTPEGVSVAVAVLNWRPSFYLMPAARLAHADPGLVSLRRLVEACWRATDPPQVTCEVVRKPRAYGYHPDPSNPAEREAWPFLRVRCASQFVLRSVAARLEEALGSGRARGGGQARGGRGSGFGEVQRMAQGAARAVVAMGGATVEEGERLRPEFKFMDEREIPPASWVVVPRGRWSDRTEGGSASFSFRQVNAVVQDPREVWALEKLLAAGVDASIMPDPNSVPPSLFAYADIEARSAAADEFPDPTHPDAPCYMVGVSFVWAFSVPPAMRRGGPGPAPPSAPPSSPWLQRRQEEVRRAAEEQKREAVAAVRAARAERLARRAARAKRYAARADVAAMLLAGGGAGAGAGPSRELLAAALNSDDESDGEEAKVRAAEAEADRETKAELAKLEAMARGRVWGAAEAAEAAEAAGPGAMAGYPFLRVLLVVGSCAPIPGAVVVTFGTEAAMLVWLRRLLFEIMDVDGIRGYNWLGFDTRYIVRRAELLGVADAALRWSHLRTRPPKYDSRGEVTLSIAKGIFRMVRLHGTNTVDMMIYLRQQLDLSSYKLEAVAAHFGVEGKHPIKPEHIFAAYSGSAEQRAVVGAYCLRDCDALVDIARASQFEVTLAQFARIMQTPAELMWTSGQQIRVVHQLIWQAHRQGFVVDGLFRDRGGEDTALRSLASGKSFSGGFVMKPAVGHYRTPTATLDYKSLYPSIMISHKLCFSTALLAPYDAPEWVARIRAAGREVLRIETESGTFHYVQHPVNMIPDMEWSLWQGRQAVKKEMKRAANDPLMYAVLDAKQLAIKVSMNSTFGVTGAEHAMLGMKRIAASITHVGRTTVQAARDFADSLGGGGEGGGGPPAPLCISVEGRDAPLPVLVPGASLRTVYGDTDSIMVNLPDALHPEAVAWAEARLRALAGEEGPAFVPSRAAVLLLLCRHVGDVITAELNKRYRHPMEIEFEEVASQAIFLAPKMYTKNVVEDLGDPVILRLAAGGKIGKLKVAGIAAKRRDRSMVTKRLQKAVASSVVHARDEARALQLVRRWVTRLALNEVALGDYVITTELKNPYERIGQAVQPHVAVAWALEHACRGSEPVRGERVPWLLVRTADPTRLTPPPSKRTTGIELSLPYAAGPEGFARSTLAQLRRRIATCPHRIAVPAAHRRLFFGDAALDDLPEATTLGSLGMSSGHKLLIRNAEAPSAKPVEVRVYEAARMQGRDEDEGEDEDEAEGEGEGEGEEGQAEGGAPPPKRSRGAAAASLTERMMFHAREMTSEERGALGKRRVAATASTLSAYARHPSEVGDELHRHVDARRYMEHVRSALEILLKHTRPDLWSQMARLFKLAEPLIDAAQGKPRQSTLAGFFTRGK